MAAEAVVERGLRGHDAAASPDLLAVDVRVEPEHASPCPLRRQRAGDHPDRGRLAGAVRAEEHGDRASGRVDRQVDERGLVSEAAAHVVEAARRVAELGRPRGSCRPSAGSVVTRAIMAYRHDASLTSGQAGRGGARHALRRTRAAGAARPGATRRRWLVLPRATARRSASHGCPTARTTLSATSRRRSPTRRRAPRCRSRRPAPATARSSARRGS